MMNGGVMRSGQLIAAAGLGPPLVPFASLPAASTIEGQVRRLAELPHVSLIALGGIWLPFGGRQVLAKRTINPVTVQSLTNVVAETIGPFPGGLVRAGMQLVFDAYCGSPGIGTGIRVYEALIGDGWLVQSNATTSSTDSNAQIRGILDVLADGNAIHKAARGPNGSYDRGSALSTPIVDFSAAWSVPLRLTSTAETAVNITSASWAAGIATFVTSAVHTLAVGDKTVIAVVSPSGYNVAAGAIVLSVPTTTSFTVAIASDPGAYTSGGTSSRISNMISQSYVLELVG